MKIYNKRSKIRESLHKTVKPELKPFYHPNLIIPSPILPWHNAPKEECSWNLEKEVDTIHFSIEVSELNHSMINHLKIKDSIYIDIRQCGNFAIEWTVIDSALPKPIRGTLNVVVKRPTTTMSCP